MNWRTLIAVSALVWLLAVPAAADVDLTVTDVQVHWAGGAVIIEAEVELAASGGHDGFIVDVGFELDGVFAGSVQLDYGAIPGSGGDPLWCENSSPPNCGGYCPPIVVNGDVVTAYACTEWLSLPGCNCIYLVATPPSDAVAYNDEVEASATVDYYDTVDESDEGNNTMTVAIEPQPAIDLSVEDAYLTWNGNSFTINAEVSAHVVGEHSGFVSDVTFYVDGEFAGSVVYDGGQFGPNTPTPCELSYPDCDGYCKPAYINGQLTSGSCTTAFWYQSSDGCGCIYLIVKPSNEMEFSSQNGADIYVDDGNAVAEGDETNNHMYCEISGSPVEAHSWSTIKALYR